jgi:hypothetical protein
MIVFIRGNYGQEKSYTLASDLIIHYIKYLSCNEGETLWHRIINENLDNKIEFRICSQSCGTITMVLPHKNNGQNKDTKKDIRIKFVRNESMGQ